MDNASAPSARARADIIVVGYGPIGMTTAALLAQEGHKVVVVERFPERYNKPRAGHFDGETMRTFDQIGVALDMELAVRQSLSYEIVTVDNEVLNVLRDGEEGSGWKTSYLFYQPDIEEIIDNRCRALGVEIIMNATAVDITQDADEATVFIRASDQPDGPSTALRARYVIGADGANSFVRERIGSAKRDLGFPPVKNVVLDFEHDDPDRDVPYLKGAGHIVGGDRTATFGRWTGGRVSRLEFRKLEHETVEELEREETAWAFLKRFDLTPENGRIVRHATYTFESSLSDPWRVGRVLLAGDAAHTTPPALGQGMCSGIRDAVNLAWKLDAVLAGRAAPSLLDTYESERAPQVNAVIEMAMQVGRRLLHGGTDNHGEELKADKNNQKQRFPRLGEGIVRRESDPSSTFADGRPVLQARVAWNRVVDRLDAFLKPGWRLITRHAMIENELTPAHRSLIRELPIAVAHISRAAGEGHYIDLDGDYELLFRSLGQKAILIRPDHYVFGGAAEMSDIPALLDALTGALEDAGWYFDQAPAGAVQRAAQSA